MPLMTCSAGSAALLLLPLLLAAASASAEPSQLRAASYLKAQVQLLRGA